MARFFSVLLSDAVLGFLALLSFFLIFMPSVFLLSDSEILVLEAVEYLIISLFVLEYSTAFFKSPDKGDFLVNPWRLVDALIIVLALAALLPGVPELLKNAPVLRAFRVMRLALLGTKTGLGVKLQPEREPEQILISTELNVTALDSSGQDFEVISWSESVDRLKSEEADWIFVGGVAEAHVPVIAEALSVPNEAIQNLFRSSIPRLEFLDNVGTLFVRYPVETLVTQRLRRVSILLVSCDHNVVVLSTESTGIENQIRKRLATLDDSLPRMVKATVALLAEVIRAYGEVEEHFEYRLFQLEASQGGLSDKDFLAKTFELRTDILRVRSSIKHIRRTLIDLLEGKLNIGVQAATHGSLFKGMAEDANALYDSIDEFRESLQALADLRLNVSSFQMNRVMRLLALLTSLALIPATAGGLLGMNLTDTPWPATLPQVAFGVAAGMAISLYAFAIKGWLR